MLFKNTGLQALALSLSISSSLAEYIIPLQNIGVPLIPASYDYIVVGGGTSGLAIAARLVETGSSVAIIEAGGMYEIEGGPYALIPGTAPAAQVGTSPDDTMTMIDWNFLTQPMSGANNRIIRYSRGKALGGTSARNFMLYQRGTKGTFDWWASLINDNAWSWDSVLPYFKKSPVLTPPNMAIRQANGSVSYNPSTFAGSNGPLAVTWPNWASPLGTWIENALTAIGFTPDVDFNTGTLFGSSWIPCTIQAAGQSRESSATSYLTSVLGAKNLKVYARTTALKINFSGNTAQSVRVDTLNLKYTLTAKKEIIIAAGAFQSPQLLMVSGIGPQATLQQRGIPVVKNLPGVGQNLQDHVIFGVTNAVNVVTATRFITDTLYAAGALVDYLQQKGPLTAPGFGIVGFEKLPNASRSALSADTQAKLARYPADFPEAEMLSIDGILNGFRDAEEQNVRTGYNYGAVAGALQAPISRGSVSISSADINDQPVIDVNYLGDPADQEVAVAIFKRAREAWSVSNITVAQEYLPGTQVTSDAQILEYIKNTVAPVWHAAGTCKMGNSSDPLAVVDSRAKVIGINKLRVVDASIFPILPPGHPQSACYMVAERVADFIKAGQ